VAAPVVLVLAIRGAVRFCQTPAEIFIGVLAGCGLGLLLTILGMVLPLSLARPCDCRAERGDR